MYKVYGPRQTFTAKVSTTTPPRLLQKRIRLVHPSHQQPANEARTPKFRWKDDDDEENLEIPNFLLKEQPSINEHKIKSSSVGLGIIFIAAFLLSFGGVYLFSHNLPTDAAQLLSSILPEPAPAVIPPDTRIAQATAEKSVPIPEPKSDDTPAETVASRPEETATRPEPVATGSEAAGTFPENALMPAMLTIKGGQYIIPVTRPDQKSNQFLPVDLETFTIATTEVTRGQWKACAAEGQCSIEGFPSQYFEQIKLSLPITSITTDQMMVFIDWINTKRPSDEPPYRLPKESEWVVAARGGSADHSDFAWGKSFDAAKIRDSDRLIPVDRNGAVNGLFGMSDNAAERVTGCWIMELSNGSCYRNLGVVRGPVPGRINGQSASLIHRASRAKNIPYENIGFRLAQ
ncbi:MAG: SUMF1/EgtB/PvdO family nonheme iron enzyme [Hyphomicrobiales bacterium]|nr:SUMF1/EgtB/PvdO family nonheme iron enzyme [Hyphomicrobiales bacterium]MCP4998994.1 SUMF1/EgtB/PvdO family nonheme iron enzyme [Hyphomicrobiales bacterium]